MFTGDWGNANIKPLFDPGTAKSKESWAMELFCAADDETKFEEVKAVSPFAGRMVIAANLYTRSGYLGDVQRFMHTKGGIEMDVVSSAIKSIIRERGFADSWNKYLLVFESGKDSGDAEVFHIGRNKKPEFEKPSAGLQKNNI